MKNLWKTLFVAALFVSCSEANVDEQPVPETTQGTPIQFELVNEGGRAAFFQGEGHRVDWEGGEKIAIRRWLGTAESPAYDANTRQRGNYTVDVNGALTLSQYDEVTYSDDAEKGTFITACYPDNTNANANKIGNLTLSAAQTQAAGNDHSHIDDYMIMMTPSPLYFEPDVAPEKVSLRLQSVLSIVEVTLKGDAEKKVAGLELVTISDSPLAYSKGVLDLTQDITAEDAACPISVTAGLSSVKLELTTPATLSAEGTKFYFVVLPGAHEKGDITIRAYMEDGSVYGMKMGAIEFKMNKVYRPSLNMSAFEEVKMTVAEIEHTFSNGDKSAVYGLPVSMEEDSTPILLRPHFEYLNMPDEVKGLQVASIVPSTYPTVNKIKALTEGWVYMMVGASGVSTVQLAKAANGYFDENGWELMTSLPTAEVNADMAATMFCYQSATDSYSALLLFRKYMQVNEEFDLSTYKDVSFEDVNGNTKKLSGSFQGIRPIAKTITNNNDDYLILPFDFSNTQQDWPIQTIFSKVLANPYTEPMTYKFLNGISYALEFSSTNNVSSCSWYNNDGTYLLMYIRKSPTGESIKLPAIEGYKLVEVQGTTYNQVADAKCFISSVSAQDYAAETDEATKAALVKSDEYAMQSGNNAGKWAHTLVDPAANTAYYLVAIDTTPATSSNGDVKMNSLVLTYQKVQ